jgi:hypothetical protein
MKPRRRGHGKPIDLAAQIAMLRRMLKAAYRNLDIGEPEQLRELFLLQDDLESLVLHAVADMRRAGVTWEAIGAANGTTRQAAVMRWGKQIAELGQR